MINRSIKLFLGILAVSAFVLNLVWEVAQVFGYSSLAESSTLNSLILCMVASFADAVITLGAYLLVALIRWNVGWWLAARFQDFLIFAVFGAISATLIELVAINRGIWSYGSYMPIVPLLKIGLLPLLQLTILLPTALWFALKWRRRWEVK